MQNNLVERAALISRLAHKGQFRRDGFTPYFTHPSAVAEKCQSGEAKCVAYLHDVIEDSGLTVWDLYRLGFSNEIVTSVYVLTHLSGETYDEYIQQVLLDRIPVEVKIADMEHNLSCQPSEHSKKKIAKWLPVLKAALTKFQSDSNVQ